jgi:hypothetical protein
MKKLSFVFILALCSCELVVDIDVPFEGEQLVINSFFNPDSVWTAAISTNQYILDERPFTRISGALVVVSDENGPVDTLVYSGNGLYRANSKPLPGKQYQVTATKLNYATASGYSFIPQPVTISSMEIHSTQNGNEPESTIKLRFQDNPDEENFYEITVDVEGENLHYPSYTILTYHYPVNIEIDEPTFSNETYWTGNRILIKDVFYKSSDITVNLRSSDYSLMYTGKVVATVRNVSEDYYNYITTAELQESTTGNPFAQPVNVYTNIQNGFGIFAGVSVAASFTAGKPRPVITNVTPTTVNRGQTITIEGENFQTNANTFIAVIFEGNDFAPYGQITQFTDNSISVIIPEPARSGRIWVAIGGQITEWEPGITIN